MEFGFVPAQVVKDLEEVGNWKVVSFCLVEFYANSCYAAVKCLFSCCASSTPPVALLYTNITHCR